MEENDLIKLDEDIRRQEQNSRWVNKDGTEFTCDVGAVMEWWENYKLELLKENK